MADCARAAAGLACTLGPILFAQPAGALIWVLGTGAGLFLVYSARTVFSFLSSVELDEQWIRARGLGGAVIRWNDLRRFRLDYYATRSDRAGGWMQLEVRGAHGRIVADSRLEGFSGLARAVANEALRRNVLLDEPTRANLSALGIAPGE